jgi:hypothetical protein
MFDNYIGPVTRTVTRFLERLEREGRVRHLDPGTWHFIVVHGAGGTLSLRALADRFGNVPSSDDDIHAYATQVVEVLLSGMSTGL